MYQPKPIDTSSVALPESLGPLVERIAEDTHDTWAAQRVKDGWTYGPKRDDGAKQHPCLVPYADLPESEREYDRKTALGALKLTVSLGYRIGKA